MASEIHMSNRIKSKRTYSRYTLDAVALLGKHIQIARKAQKLTIGDFSDRIGVSPTTLQKIEKGDLKCEIGIVFEAAALVGIQLFDTSTEQTFTSKLESADNKLALLPKSIRPHHKELDDDF